ncbi:hypothetical protein [Klebsiella phage phiKp_21]|nr:hypothetical protein [Klebsiella phage phiKp_21]
MKFHDIVKITEDAPPKDIRNMITSIALSLVASGREEVGIQSLVNEIKKRTGIDVPYNVMMDILNSLPFVQDANSDRVQFSGTDTSTDFKQPNSEESSEQKVQDMAGKAATDSMKSL